MKRDIIFAIIALFIGLLLGVGIYKKSHTQYFDKPGFKSDTIIREKFVRDTGTKLSKEIPPKIVYIYKNVPVPIIKYVPYLVHDTIRLKDTLTGKTVDLYPCWYNAYLGEQKLISGRFSKNGISLDLYDSGCKMLTKVYQVDYDQYDYFWTGTDIRISKQKLNTIPKIGSFWKQFTCNSNAYVVTDLLSRHYYLSADYSLNYRRVGLYVSGEIGFKTELETRVNFGIKLRLR